MMCRSVLCCADHQDFFLLLWSFDSLNPIFTDAQNNAFLLDCASKELFDNKGLLFKVKDYNRLSADQDIGSILVPAMELIKATGEVQEYVLVPPSDVPPGTNVGKLKFRCFPATESHLEKLGRDKKGLRGFVSGIQHKVQSGAQDITHKATASMRDLGQKVVAVPQAVKDASHAISPSFLKKEDESSAKGFSADEDIGSVTASIAEATTSEPAVTDNNILMLVEIVAGRDLLIGDTTSSGRYFRVEFLAGMAADLDDAHNLTLVPSP
jgi:hypothetical protein